MKSNDNDTFYGKKGIALLITVTVIIAVVGTVGMYAIGVLKIPSFISEMLNQTDIAPIPHAAGNISANNGEITYYEALPREEYAIALADITIPEQYYQNYSISLFSGDSVHKTDYTAIYNEGDWWVQTAEEGVILSTTVCKDGKVTLWNNADNSYVTDESGELNHYEYFGYPLLSTITDMIRALAKGESVDYAGGVLDFSLSYTQSRGTGENIFSFNLTRADGFKEEYTFAFESATILSAAKYSPSGEKIYQMEMKNSKNDIEGIDVDLLFAVK